jgi:hypothetical protein
MYYNKEKRIFVSLISTILILGSYILYVYHNNIAENPEIIHDFKFWGKTFLILIPVMIVAQIVIHIVFIIINKIITNEDVPKVTDERDKLIELKAIRVSHWTYCLGFLMAMGSQAIGMKPWIMFMTLVASCFIASEIVKIFLYRRGF